MKVKDSEIVQFIEEAHYSKNINGCTTNENRFIY